MYKIIKVKKKKKNNNLSKIKISRCSPIFTECTLKNKRK